MQRPSTVEGVKHHLAQLNVAKLRAPLDSPELTDFVSALEGCAAP